MWTKDGGELPDPERMVINGRDLKINFLNKTDNGTYRCEATNSIGQNSTEYVLIVHGEYISLSTVSDSILINIRNVYCFNQL